ncbi:restriction endonuclease subunit S [Segatella copri]|mgnify:CR=1 FL=1|jgi:type I restriction enzyme S subunit|uniref:restriction endonuclease subunit S n=1 Tax=Segatella copri TaxID=165179 RepID=UPI001C480510|nr:restriction endonuclease subunit S [Segatella copri]WOZ84759.1 restriction endonuclease subunit S [Segatella copri]
MDTKALRQKILDLAIHGKLVPQDPNDEPASVLLERIRAEKERLIKEGKIKKGKKSAKTSDKPHYPFELPKGWVWCMLEDIAYDLMYGTSEKSSRLGKVPVLRMGNINREGGLDWKDLVYSNNEEDIEKFKLLHNDLLFNRTNSSEWVGKTAIYKGERPAIYAGYIIRLRTIFVNADYINFVMNSQYHRNWCNDVKTDAVNQSNINAQKLSIFRVPLPPIEEQKRIVKEIKRWLSLIKVIKNGKENLQESIKQIKSKVLDLAIHGKLVPQDPNDEPASELLKRINPKAEITCDTPQYGKLPKGWCSCTLRNVCSFTNGFAFSSDAYKNNGIPLVRISNITNEGKIDLNSCVYIQDEIDEQYIIEKGDFLVAMSGATTGKMGVYTYGEISYLNQRVGKIKASKALYTPYMHYLMYSQVDNILKMAYGGAQPNISAKAILAIRILLPPLAEQQRIVAKIEDLFTQLDKIEASL